MSLPLPLLQAYHAIAGNVAHSPLHGGVKVYHPTKREAGTIACVVTRGGKPYLLSNQHVFGVATEGKASYDSANKMQVAIVEDTKSKDPRGTQYVDAALAAPLLPVSFDIPRLGIPKGYTEPKKGMKVKSYGITAGYVTGRITNENFPLRHLTNAAGKALAVSNEGLSVFMHDMPIRPGDSGSIVMNDSNMVVGLNFGGSNTGGSACRASAIARAYPGISFVGRSGTMQPAIKQPIPLPPAKGTNEPKVAQAGVFPSIDLGDLLPAGLSGIPTPLLIGGALIALYIVARAGGR